jgi:hypothetical protein
MKTVRSSWSGRREEEKFPDVDVKRGQRTVRQADSAKSVAGKNSGKESEHLF